jgi:hypothetical protein
MVNIATVMRVWHVVAYLIEASCYRPKVSGSIPDEVIEFFFNLPNPSSRTMNNRNLPGVKGGRQELKIDNLAAICEMISRKCGSLDVSQPYGPPRPVTVIALLLFFGVIRVISFLDNSWE